VRTVLDTNVLLSATFFSGVCEKVLVHWFLDRSVHLILSEFILREFVEHGIGKLNGTTDQIESAVAELRQRCEMVLPERLPTDSVNRPDDLAVLGTAIAGQADCLVTGDRDVLALRVFRSTEILSPRAFYDRIQME
jgi:putative PIN family toxin of toxin-antitoxin system